MAALGTTGQFTDQLIVSCSVTDVTATQEDLAFNIAY